MKKRFSIRYKILTIFLVFIIALILFILLVTGFQMRKSNREQFHKNMQQNIKLIEYSINLFFDNTKQMLATLSDNRAPYVAPTKALIIIRKRRNYSMLIASKKALRKRLFLTYLKIFTLIIPIICAYLWAPSGADIPRRAIMPCRAAMTPGNVRGMNRHPKQTAPRLSQKHISLRQVIRCYAFPKVFFLFKMSLSVMSV